MNAQAAAEIGREFARQGRPITDCPYDANGEGEERVYALRFVRGYNQIAPLADVDYDEQPTD
jgi:hypothetical protein